MKIHIAIEFLLSLTAGDKNLRVMTTEVDMAKWSELGYVTFEINHVLVMSILKMLPQAGRYSVTHCGGSRHQKGEFLYVPDSLEKDFLKVTLHLKVGV